MATLLLAAVLSVVASAGVWKGSGLIETAGERLSAHYGLPPVVEGAVVAAVGSSFPELSVSVISVLLHGKFDLGVGAIVGSAIFNVLVIPGAASLYADGDLESSRDVVYKEAQFYMLSVAVLLLVFSLGVIYYPTPDGRLTARITRPLALLPVALYGLYVFIQYADTVDYEGPTVDDVDVGKQWVSLLVGLVVVLAAVEAFVRSATIFGEAFGTPEALWGLTVVAAGTSLPDTLVSVRAARGGRGVTSLGNVLGSNVFDLLVAVPAGILLAGSAVVDYAVAVPMMGFLTLATVVLFATLRTDLRLGRREAVSLLAVYGAFLGWMALETVGVTSLVPGV